MLLFYLGNSDAGGTVVLPFGCMYSQMVVKQQCHTTILSNYISALQ